MYLKAYISEAYILLAFLHAFNTMRHCAKTQVALILWDGVITLPAIQSEKPHWTSVHYLYYRVNYLHDAAWTVELFFVG